MRTTGINAVPDEELVRWLAGGRREGLQPLHERYGALLTSLAARDLCRSTAEEVLQDVCWQDSE
jgi:hypothetical protein